ncbi:MAG: class I SAM-dependent methyltransferase [Caulobacteraceae bacterium]
MGYSLGLSDEVRDYVRRVGVAEHPVLARCRTETAADPRAQMQISPEQGAFMQVLATAIRARRALEVGVFTGYSSTAVALAMQAMHGADAELIACDISGSLVDRAAGYWRAAEVEAIVQARVGPGGDSLRALLDEGLHGHFDLMFIDADKGGYDVYYELGLELVRPGGLILIDNMLWSGAVADPKDSSADTLALRALAAKIHADPRVTATLAAVGDGLSIVVRK